MQSLCRDQTPPVPFFSPCASTVPRGSTAGREAVLNWFFNANQRQLPGAGLYVAQTANCVTL